MIKVLTFYTDNKDYRHKAHGYVTKPLHKFFEDEEVSDDNWGDCINDYPNTDMDKDEYTDEQYELLNQLGIDPETDKLLAELITGKRANAPLGDLPPGTIIIYRMPYTQNQNPPAQNGDPKVKVRERRPTVRVNINNLAIHQNEVPLLMITSSKPKDFNDDTDVYVGRRKDVLALGLSKSSYILCDHICPVDASYLVPCEDVRGCLNNAHVRNSLWQKVKQKCDKLPDDLPVMPDEGNITVNEGIGSKSENVIAFIVMP